MGSCKFQGSERKASKKHSEEQCFLKDKYCKDQSISILQTRDRRRKVARYKRTTVTIYKMWQEKDDADTNMAMWKSNTES